MIYSVISVLAGIAAMATHSNFDLANRTVIATLHAEGAQIYQCKTIPNGDRLAWTFREPVASLIDNGTTVGRHFAGPHWQLDDGSLVQAKMAESAAGSTSADIPLLRLQVIQNNDRGRLGHSTQVYRVHTRGGVLQGACDTLGQMRSAAYSADYVFTR